jgi:predicted nucleic acid-binding protein
VKWVVDASAVAALLLGEGTDVERSAMRGDVHAAARRGVTQILLGAKLSAQAAERGRLELGQFSVRRHPDAALLARARELRDRCAIYDGQYVALAEAMSATLVTRD